MKIQSIIKKTGYLLKETFNEFITDNALKFSAALSFYTIFSLPPLLVIIISLCGLFFGEVAVKGEIFSQINGVMGNAAALQIQEIIVNVKLSNSSNFAAVISVIILIIGASGVFAEIQESINYIWGIKAKPKRGLIKFTINRIMSLSMIGSLGFLLLVSLIINYLMDFINKRLLEYFQYDSIYLFYFINTFILFIIITIFFVIIFKSLPDGKVAFSDCLIGASFSAFLFITGKLVIGTYFVSFLNTSIYGAAGSVILILVWIYYSAIILYFGAEFIKVYAYKHGHKIVPNNYSVEIVKSNNYNSNQK